MKRLTFSETDLTRKGLWRVYTSEGGESRLIEGVFQQNQEIGPHIHPFGEDCAILLNGQLTYYISNRETILVRPGELVLGWQNVIHGYLNQQSEPVHLLIFATPSETGLEYPDDASPAVHHLPVDRRRITPESDEQAAHSAHSSFRFLTVAGTYREEREEGVLKIFVDWERKEALIFDGEEVLLENAAPRMLLRYSASS